MSVKNLIIEQLSLTVGGVEGFNIKKADFHQLNSAQVERVLYWANSYGYRPPRNANGSKARYFFYMLQRHAIKGMNK